MAQIAEPGGWDPASPDAAQLPTRKSIAHLATRLATAEARRAALFQQGDRLIQKFKTKYPDAPAYLVRYADRTLNDYRWRLSGHAKWRHLGLPSNKACLLYTSDAADDAMNV